MESRVFRELQRIQYPCNKTELLHAMQRIVPRFLEHTTNSVNCIHVLLLMAFYIKIKTNIDVSKEIVAFLFNKI